MAPWPTFSIAWTTARTRLREARTALSIDPNNADAYQYLGLGLYSNYQYRAAVHAYAESLAPRSQQRRHLLRHGHCLARGRKSAWRHRRPIEQAIRLRPAFWEAHSNLGLILHEQGNLDRAVAEYREAKRIAPSEASVRNNLGNTYCDQGNYDLAIEELQSLYSQHPEWQQGHACLASAYMAKKNYDAAVEELRLALRQNPTGSTEHRILGQALMLDNKPDEALRELQLGRFSQSRLGSGASPFGHGLVSAATTAAPPRRNSARHFA